MSQNYLLDTNAYFNLLKLLKKYKEESLEYPGSIDELLNANLYISTITKVEIISALGKYARGNSGGRHKCNCIISEDGEICSNYKYTAPRKKWSKKTTKGWLRLFSETISGESALMSLGVLSFTETTITEAERIVTYALEHNFGSMDAMIAATAKEANDGARSMIVVTSDKGLKACLGRCSIPYWDVFAELVEV